MKSFLGWVLVVLYLIVFFGVAVALILLGLGWEMFR